MRHENENSRSSLGSLLRFLGGYAAVVSILVFVLPAGARQLEAGYDALDGTVKLALAVAAACVVASWGWLARTRRNRRGGRLAS